VIITRTYSDLHTVKGYDVVAATYVIRTRVQPEVAHSNNVTRIETRVELIYVVIGLLIDLYKISFLQRVSVRL